MLEKMNSSKSLSVKQECRSFCSVLVSSMKERLAPMWDYTQALELVDPMGPDLERYGTESLWNTVEYLCHRHDIDFDKCQHVNHK